MPQFTSNYMAYNPIHSTIEFCETKRVNFSPAGLVPSHIHARDHAPESRGDHLHPGVRRAAAREDPHSHYRETGFAPRTAPSLRSC